MSERHAEEERSQEPALYPPWRQAERDLLARGLAAGAVIEVEWLHQAFGIRRAETIAQHKKNELLFLQQFDQLRTSLLERHNIMLRAVHGVGYAVIPPERQTDVAMKDRQREIKAAMRKLASEVSHIALDQLTDEQRKANADARARVAGMGAMFRKRLTGPSA